MLRCRLPAGLLLAGLLVGGLLVGCLLVGCLLVGGHVLAATADPNHPEPTRSEPPNVVIIFTDDQGYADVGVYGAQGFTTPHLDQMAADGIRFTDFYVAQAVCTASRAALLTGCYPNRIGMLGALGPRSNSGISDGETTLAGMLREVGYATAIYGKWHLGLQDRFLPTRHGFDEFYGIPYSNDMWPLHPQRPDAFPDLPLFENEEVVNAAVTPEDQERFTTEFTERAVDFIRRHADQPFFVYLAHPMPHVPLYVSDRFRGASEQGLYGDVIMEIDWSVGEILRTLEELELEEHTLVLFTSDNGPWLSYGNHAGSAGPLREGKGTTWDGGHRVPFLARWTGRIPAGAVCHEPAMTIDLLPTLAALAGAALPEHPIDGQDIWPLLAGDPDARSPQDAYFFYWGRELQAVRAGPWKLHFPHAYRYLVEDGADGQPGRYTQRKTPLALFDLQNDLSQQIDLSSTYPEVVQRLKAHADRARQELGDSRTNVQGTGVRPPGRVN